MPQTLLADFTWLIIGTARRLVLAQSRALLTAVGLFALCWFVTLPAHVAGAAQSPHLGQGSDLELGGPGEGHGTFGILRGIAFDEQNFLYVLDGSRYDKATKSLVGNLLVQKFDGTGKFLSQFSVRDEKLGDKDEPSLLAVDAMGDVYVTKPSAGVVQRYRADGKLLGSFNIPGALATAVRKTDGKEQIVVVPNLNKGKVKTPVQQIAVIESGGTMATPIALGQPVSGAKAAACDAVGNLYILADTNQLYKFDPAGKLLAIVGGGTELRIEDGSELMQTIAVDSKGFVYGITPGNPGKVTRFNPELTRLSQRVGRFSFFEPWGVFGASTPFAIDRQDRLWVGADAVHNPHPDPSKPGHFRPCVLRTAADFFTTGPAVTETSAMGLGLNFAIETKLPYNVTNQLASTTVDFVVRAGTRRVDRLTASWHVYDVYKKEIAKGEFDVALQDGVEARHAIDFTPPKWGVYAIDFQVHQQGGDRLAGVGAFIGFTPAYPGMATLSAGDSQGGWEDPVRQAFCGLSLIRVHPTAAAMDMVEKEIADASARGLTILAQLSSLKECNVEFAKQAVARFKGKVKYWEVFNEPNLQMGAEKYVAVLAETSKAIKAADPDAMVLGPTCCGINLKWYGKFYELGGGKLCDVISMHDYEGNEAVDPFFWPWKIGELRKIMAANGDAGKALWQTERAMSGVDVFMYQGGAQALRVTLRYDLLETMSIPQEHNLHYYLNEGGYTSVPSWVWSRNGPYPVALAMRTRYAMTHGRPFVSKLDFGPTGTKMFLALFYKGTDGSTLCLRNLGTLDTPLELSVTGGDAVEVVDAFGNAQQLPVREGKVTLVTTAMPQYVRLSPAEQLSAPKIDYGQNIASQAKFAYSAESKGDVAALTNGIFESSHLEDPHRNQQWIGDLPSTPQTLDITFAEPRTVNKMLIFSMRADNDYCALLDYDLQYHDGKEWVTIQEVRTPCPPTDRVVTGLPIANMWYLDTNFFAHAFKPLVTDRLRLVVRRTTFGLFADRDARDLRHKPQQAKLMLREIEIYGPASIGAPAKP